MLRAPLSHPSLARVASGAAAPAHGPGLGHEVRERRAQVVYRLNPGVLKGLGRGQPGGPVGGWSIVRVRFDVRSFVASIVASLQRVGCKGGDRHTTKKKKHVNLGSVSQYRRFNNEYMTQSLVFRESFHWPLMTRRRGVAYSSFTEVRLSSGGSSRSHNHFYRPSSQNHTRYLKILKGTIPTKLRQVK